MLGESFKVPYPPGKAKCSSSSSVLFQAAGAGRGPRSLCARTFCTGVRKGKSVLNFGDAERSNAQGI